MLLAMMTAAMLTLKTPAEVKPMATQTMILDNDYNFREVLSAERRIIERCVMSEAGNQSIECQEAVATTILNRWLCDDKFPETITGVITEPAQYSIIDNGEPTVSVRVAVNDAIRYYNTEEMCIPKNCYYFRADYYHSFGIPYMSIDDTYFSLAEDATL